MKVIRHQSFAVSIVLVLALQAIGPAQTRTDSPVIDGFSAKTSDIQRQFEGQFRSVPQPATAREELRRLTSEAHIAGSPEDYATAVYVRDQMRGFGLSSELREYQVLLPYPRTPGIVELIAPRRERLQVRTRSARGRTRLQYAVRLCPIRGIRRAGRDRTD